MEDTRKQGPGAEIENLIARLSKEKEERELGWFKRGKELGFDWFKQAHYNEVMIVLNTVISTDILGALSEYDRCNMNWYNDAACRGETLTPGDTERFWDGFAESVTGFWDTVKECV